MSQFEDLAAAYRILAEHGVIDGYGHVSVRSERDPKRYFLARSLAPEIVTDEDIMAFYGRLPHPDKQMVKIGGLAHTAGDYVLVMALSAALRLCAAPFLAAGRKRAPARAQPEP